MSEKYPTSNHNGGILGDVELGELERGRQATLDRIAEEKKMNPSAAADPSASETAETIRRIVDSGPKDPKEKPEKDKDIAAGF